MREHGHLGIAQVSELLGRSESSVRAAAHRHGISLRRPGTLCGLVVGQNRAVSLRRAAPTSGPAALRFAEATARRLQLVETAALCPCCGKRSASPHLGSGWCETCHKTNLADAQRETRDAIDAQRDLWAARQSVQRGRDAALRMVEA